MRIIRVFPSVTRATPDDPLAYSGEPDFWAAADEVHISVTFTWDIPAAERLEKEWRHVAPVKIGGPALGTRGEAFAPGQYIKHGYVITSRGCPNKCWFCSVWKRDGTVRELPICDGWNVLDDNLLACSEQHIRSVFAMLDRQDRRPEFTGGLEAKRMQPWIAESLKAIRTAQLFFAYDTADDLPPLKTAVEMMKEAGFKGHPKSHVMRCYVLCGWPKDTIPASEARMRECLELGVLPMAMLWRDKDGKRDPEWARWQRLWSRPAITSTLDRQPAMG